MKTLYIIDAINVLFRSYYAIGPMTNNKGESTNALYGFIRSIYKLIAEFSPDYFIAVFDGPDNKKSRTEIYKDYKGHRAGMPEDLVPQLENAHKFCELAGIPMLSVSGVEADDTIGSIAVWAEEFGLDVYICSSDKDLCQLITSHIKVINLHKNNLLIDKKMVEELFGVRPDQMIDYLAIVGDASDNIPGLEGFGPKTAASLLGSFDTLDNILAHPEKVPGKKQQTLIEGKPIALMSRALATINKEVDFPKNLEFFSLKMPKMQQIEAFYQEMKFLSLLRELNPETESHPTAQAAKEENVCYQTVDDEDVLIELIQELLKEKEICIDTETTDVRPMSAKLVGIGLGIEPGQAWYVPLNGNIPKERVLKLLKPLLEHPKISFIGHNIKYDLHVLWNEGITLSQIAFDTILASYLISPHVQRHNLDELSLEKFGKVKIPIEELLGKGKKQITMDQVPIAQVTAYCCEDVDYTLRLKQLFEKQLDHLELNKLFNEIEIPLIYVLAKMERAGIYVDLKQLKQMSQELEHSLHQLERAITHLAGETFNLNSPKQLSMVLFEKMGIKPPKKTTTGYSTAADVLESLKEEHPIIKKILDYRALEKLRSTYVDALPLEVSSKTHRIHCTFNQSVAATGRLSCQSPNLQNIPVRSEEGKKIRRAFEPQKPHTLFLSADYSQIELRLLAHLSEDPILIQAFLQGEDIHAFTASLVFMIPIEEVTSEMRSLAKAVNFGILYGQQAFGLSQQIGIEYKEAASFIDAYFERYPKVKEFLELCKQSARKTGKAVTMTGRQRPIPEIHSKNPMIRAQAERLAINTPLQGTAADLIKMAMIEIDTLLQKKPDLGTMILQIHDELIFETPHDQADKLSSHVKKIMEGILSLKVPLVVDISIGKNWAEC